MSAISFRRSRFLRICVVALLLVPIIYLLSTWFDNNDVPKNLHLVGNRKTNERPKLVHGK